MFVALFLREHRKTELKNAKFTLKNLETYEKNVANHTEKKNMSFINGKRVRSANKTSLNSILATPSHLFER